MENRLFASLDIKPLLYFNRHQSFILYGNNIYLAKTGGEPSVQNPVALKYKECGGSKLGKVAMSETVLAAQLSIFNSAG
jgi:hypothetical protein